MTGSLRRRAIIGGAIWAMLTVAICSAALFNLFERQAAKRFDTDQLSRQLQVISALANSDGDMNVLEALLTDPAYARPYSGNYWQIDGPDQKTFASRSLFDTLFEKDDQTSTTPSIWLGAGPNGPVRGIRQLVQLDDGTEWVVTVAETLETLAAERRQIRQNLLVSFGFVGFLGIAGAILLTSAVLRPLGKLREDVLNRWESGEKLNPDDYAAEVAPLVSDIDTLLERNHEIIDRSRRQAADLAHALKTPSAILRNEVEAAKANGTKLELATDALDRIDAQISRSLARIRAGNFDPVRGQNTPIKHSVERLLRLFNSAPDAEKLTFNTDVSPDLSVAMDRQDLEETLGNIIENATKWAKSTISITARQRDNSTDITIDDDGPGVSEEQRQEALRTGRRLDTSIAGSGLGLAIAADLLDAYGGSIKLDTSEPLSGLRVTISVPNT